MTTETYSRVIEYLRDIITSTPWQGHVFAVGGCCRDVVMDRPINDIDLAVDLPNGGVRFACWLFEKGLTRTHPVLFEKYGTAMLELNEFPDLEIEIVQTRKGRYTPENEADGPEAVFGTVMDDAMRRDLTINTLFYNISEGRMLDITGRALSDIATCRIATPMSPRDTFIDDPIRILRTIRMASSLGWEIDADTLCCMRELAPELRNIKVERIRAEFEKMITGKDPVRALGLMARCGVLEAVAPEFGRMSRGRHGKNSGGSREWRRILRALALLAPAGEPALAWAIMLRSLRESPAVEARNKAIIARARAQGKRPRTIFAPYERILRRVHHHSKFIKLVEFLIKNVDATDKWPHDVARIKERQLKSFRRMCVTPERMDLLLRYIYVNDMLSETPRPQRVPEIRKRLEAMA